MRVLLGDMVIPSELIHSIRLEVDEAGETIDPIKIEVVGGRLHIRSIGLPEDGGQAALTVVASDRLIIGGEVGTLAMFDGVLIVERPQCE